MNTKEPRKLFARLCYVWYVFALCVSEKNQFNE